MRERAAYVAKRDANRIPLAIVQIRERKGLLLRGSPLRCSCAIGCEVLYELWY